MAVTIKNTNYDGEVLDRILTKAATGNELVQKGLINLVPDVTKKYSIPRLKTNKMLRKRVEQPEDKNSKGDFIYSEKVLEPKDFMAFTTFNPRSFRADMASVPAQRGTGIPGASPQCTERPSESPVRPGGF